MLLPPLAGEGMGRGLDADPYGRQRRMDYRVKPGHDDA
jgi:hypothetical protein